MTRLCDCGDPTCVEYLNDCFSLAYDVSEMEGKLIEFEDEFESLDSLSQADILQDWIGILRERYDEVTGADFLKDHGATTMNEEPPTGTTH